MFNLGQAAAVAWSLAAAQAAAQLVQSGVVTVPQAAAYLGLGVKSGVRAGQPAGANKQGATMPSTQNIEFRIRTVVHPVMGDVLAVQTSRFHSGVVQALKGAYPPKRAAWDGASKVWFVHDTSAGFANLVPVICRNAGVTGSCALDPAILPHLPSPAQAPPRHQAQAPGGRPAPQPAGADFFRRQYATAEDWRVLWVIEGAPFEVAKASYRALAALHHPDRGGDAEVIKRVAKAWERVSKTFEKGAGA